MFYIQISVSNVSIREANPHLDQFILSFNSDKPQETIELFKNYLQTHSLEEASTLLSDLKTYFYSPKMLGACRELLIDDLWLIWARTHLSNGNLELPTNLLLTNQGTGAYDLNLDGTVKTLLGELVNSYLEMRDIASIKSLIDAILKDHGSSGIEPDYITDRVIDATVSKLLAIGLVADAIELSAQKATPHDRGDLLLSNVEVCLRENQLETAKTLAAAIPIAQRFGNTCPRLACGLPHSWNKDQALKAIQEYEASLVARAESAENEGRKDVR